MSDQAPKPTGNEEKVVDHYSRESAVERLQGLSDGDKSMLSSALSIEGLDFEQVVSWLPNDDLLEEGIRESFIKELALKVSELKTSTTPETKRSSAKAIALHFRKLEA